MTAEADWKRDDEVMIAGDKHRDRGKVVYLHDRGATMHGGRGWSYCETRGGPVVGYAYEADLSRVPSDDVVLGGPEAEMIAGMESFLAGEPVKQTFVHRRTFDRVVYDPREPAAVPMAAPGDPVDHPAHYNAHPSGIECIDVARHFNFNLGNVIKYIWRAPHKGASLQDLRKAAWYLADEIARMEREAKS